MVATSADHVDTMVADEPIVRPEQGLQMPEHTPRPQPPAPVQWPQTQESRPQPCTSETHPLCRQEHLGLVTPQKPPTAVPTLRTAQAAGNTSDLEVDQQLLIESEGGASRTDVTLPDAPHPDVPLPNVPPLDVPLPDVPLPDVSLPDVPLPDVPIPDVRFPDVRFPDVRFPDVRFHDVPFPDVPLPDARLPDVNLSEPRPDGLVGEK